MLKTSVCGAGWSDHATERESGPGGVCRAAKRVGSPVLVAWDQLQSQGQLGGKSVRGEEMVSQAAKDGEECRRRWGGWKQSREAALAGGADLSCSAHRGQGPALSCSTMLWPGRNNGRGGDQRLWMGDAVIGAASNKGEPRMAGCCRMHRQSILLERRGRLDYQSKSQQPCWIKPTPLLEVRSCAKRRADRRRAGGMLCERELRRAVTLRLFVFRLRWATSC